MRWNYSVLLERLRHRVHNCSRSGIRRVLTRDPECFRNTPEVSVLLLARLLERPSCMHNISCIFSILYSFAFGAAFANMGSIFVAVHHQH